MTGPNRENPVLKVHDSELEGTDKSSTKPSEPPPGRTSMLLLRLSLPGKEQAQVTIKLPILTLQESRICRETFTRRNCLGPDTKVGSGWSGHKAGTAEQGSCTCRMLAQCHQSSLKNRQLIASTFMQVLYMFSAIQGP